MNTEPDEERRLRMLRAMAWRASPQAWPQGPPEVEEAEDCHFIMSETEGQADNGPAMSFAEIGLALGVSPARARMLVDRALSKVSKALAIKRTTPEFHASITRQDAWHS